MFTRDTITKIVLTVYLLSAVGYLFLAPNRGPVDVLYLLFPPLVWALTCRLRFKNRVILTAGALVVFVLASMNTESAQLRYWCYGGFQMLSGANFDEEMKTLHTFYDLYCHIEEQLLAAGLSLLFPVVGVGLIALVTMWIWKDKKAPNA